MDKCKYSYDPSLDYVRYPTLAPLPQHLLGSAQIPDQLPKRTAARPLGRPTFQVAESSGHTVILLPNGTVYAYGDNEHGQCDVSGWRDIVSVGAGLNSTAGLCADGTVRRIGEDMSELGNYDTSTWRGITAISVDGYEVFGLLSDGSWLKTDYFDQGPYGDNCISIVQDAFLFADGTVALEYIPEGFEEVASWKNIVKLAYHSPYLAALAADGTVKSLCHVSHPLLADRIPGALQVSDWRGIKDIAVSFGHIVGLCADGTLRAAGDNQYGQCNVGHLQNVKAIAVSDFHTVALLSNGTVEAVGEFSESDRCSVWDWTDVAAIWAANDFTVALRHDGTFLCTDPALQKRLDEALA